MRRARFIALASTAALALFALAAVNPHNRFVLGGALVGAGQRVQDQLARYDLVHDDSVESPEQVWAELLEQNRFSSGVREVFPRATEHPLVALLLCMDARLDVSELTGDSRGYYYVVRTAGSVLGPAEQDMLELAVANGVKVVVLTRHTDCAAERAAHDPASAQRYPHLTKGVLEREARVREFLARPLIARRIEAGELLVKEVLIDTRTEHVLAGAKAP